MAHTRSSPQEPINQGVIGQPIIPQVDAAQILQTLPNQLALSSQLNLQQPTPSAGQPIEKLHLLWVIQTHKDLLEQEHQWHQIHSQEPQKNRL
jgi:hypothetical protein